MELITPIASTDIFELLRTIAEDYLQKRKMK
jgi:hypothetical protein